MFFNEDGLAFVEDMSVEFDYVILLNVFHHLLVQDEKRGWEMFNKLIDNSGGIFVMMRNSLKHWNLCPKRVQIPNAVVERSKAVKSVVYDPINGRNVIFFSK